MSKVSRVTTSSLRVDLIALASNWSAFITTGEILGADTASFFRDTLATLGPLTSTHKGVTSEKSYGLGSLFLALYAGDAALIPESIAAILAATRSDRCKSKGEAITTEGRIKNSWSSTLSQMQSEAKIQAMEELIKQTQDASEDEGSEDADSSKDYSALLKQTQKNLVLLLEGMNADTLAMLESMGFLFVRNTEAVEGSKAA